MNFRTTVYLLALLLVAGTVFLVIHYRQNQTPTETTKDERKLVDLEQTDLAKVVVTPAGGKLMVLEKFGIEKDTIGGILRYGPVPVALATMGFKHRALPHDKVLASLTGPNFLPSYQYHCPSSILTP